MDVMAEMNLQLAYAKIELSPAEESGNQGFQLRGFSP
jgi:hypothetical protein